MIVFVNTSITTINLIKKNPHFDFEYIFFNKKNKNIILEIKDNGQGVGKEFLQKINKTKTEKEKYYA